MNKISIAIIDDESLVRLGIKSSVEWENYGYEIIGEADNGKNGLEMIQQKQPDIVLLDICMPVMDGIEVLKRLQQMEIDCKVIILSCHDDFHFVKEAMKNGAYDYLRKNEINSANILNILEEVRQSVREERKNKEASEEREEWGGCSRHSWLQRLVTEGTEADGHSVPVSRLHIQEGGLCCVVFGVSHYRQVLTRYEDGYPFTLEHSITNLAKEVIRQRTREMEIFLFQENQYVLLLSSRDSVSGAQWEEEVFSLINELYTVFRNYLNAETYYGASGIVSKFSGLPEAFERAQYSYKLHYFQPDKIILKEVRKPARTLSEEEVKSGLNEINSCISQKQYSHAFSHLYTFIQWLRRHHRENLDVAGILNFFSNMVRFILLQEGKIPEETIDKLQKCENLEDTEQFLSEFQRELKAEEPELDQKHYLIRAATDYIQQNLSRGDISLDEIAEHLMISKSYLCRLFQKKLGVSVQHYIHNIRIEKAKEYLNDFRLKIYEIAELTGFNSSTHFNIVFKKIMQCTPVEYRNGLKQ